MEDQYSIPLRDGRTLEIEVLTFPIDSSRQKALIGLWRTEWTQGDYDWLRSMNGDYSRHLRIQAVLGTIEGRPAGTASVCYPCQEPEVSVVGSVLTHPDCRRLGVAEALTGAVVDLSYRAGCRVSYLGATRDPRNVYLRCGFRWWNGGVMRREREDSSRCEEAFFATGQATSVRESNWGDLPAFACFVVQPWDTRVLDYPRALLSGKYVKLQRCVSNFPAVHEEAGAARRGAGRPGGPITPSGPGLWLHYPGARPVAAAQGGHRCLQPRWLRRGGGIVDPVVDGRGREEGDRAAPGLCGGF